ncbi:LysE family translocator [Marinomonas sp. C2222]|uniref:LysE family translocator n=1 Tax=Marinomonas sargassi TaxID=2984494 RepID=A0ABT2YRR4_9GAMM|nr:LysE family translocator [Marinomonas sargassi]MCV2402556.1 LysE family translocator [Marinomonas sargassi]
MIDWSYLLAVALFAFVMSGTPGPNNIMLLASGAQFGFIRTLPHMLGISVGVATLVTAVLLGVGGLFLWYPPLYVLLKWLGGAYLLFLAWKIASAPVTNFSQEQTAKSEPMRWWQAALFQFVNPKAWMMAISAISTFAIPGELYAQSGIWIVCVFTCVNLPTISIWVGLGTSIRRLLTNVKRQRIFNIVMGVVTGLTLIMIVID